MGDDFQGGFPPTIAKETATIEQILAIGPVFYKASLRLVRVFLGPLLSQSMTL